MSLLKLGIIKHYSSQLNFYLFTQQKPLSEKDINKLYEGLVKEMDKSLGDIKKLVEKQKMEEEQERLRKIQEEMERQRKKKEEEERIKREEEEQRKK